MYDNVSEANDGLALAQKTVFRNRLLVIIYPSRKIGVRIRLDVPKNAPIRYVESSDKKYQLIDICLSWEGRGVTSDVDLVLLLVYANPINRHH